MFVVVEYPGGCFMDVLCSFGGALFDVVCFVDQPVMTQYVDEVVYVDVLTL